MGKKCGKCGGPGPFYRCKAKKDGLSTYCKVCSHLMAEQWRKDHPERFRELRRNAYQRNKKKIRKRDNKYKRTYACRPEVRVRKRVLQNNWNRKKKYGLTPSQYQALLDLQGGVCAICGRLSRRSLDVDHDHKTGKVRGLLCFSCNTGLGHFGESPEILKKATEYLLQDLDLPADPARTKS